MLVVEEYMRWEHVMGIPICTPSERIIENVVMKPWLCVLEVVYEILFSKDDDLFLCTMHFNLPFSKY